jgi:hypothetical protein
MPTLYRLTMTETRGGAGHAAQDDDADSSADGDAGTALPTHGAAAARLHRATTRLEVARIGAGACLGPASWRPRDAMGGVHAHVTGASAPDKAATFRAIAAQPTNVLLVTRRDLSRTPRGEDTMSKILERMTMLAGHHTQRVKHLTSMRSAMNLRGDLLVKGCIFRPLAEAKRSVHTVTAATSARPASLLEQKRDCEIGWHTPARVDPAYIDPVMVSHVPKKSTQCLAQLSKPERIFALSMQRIPGTGPPMQGADSMPLSGSMTARMPAIPPPAHRMESRGRAATAREHSVSRGRENVKARPKTVSSSHGGWVESEIRRMLHRRARSIHPLHAASSCPCAFVASQLPIASDRVFGT